MFKKKNKLTNHANVMAEEKKEEDRLGECLIITIIIISLDHRSSLTSLTKVYSTCKTAAAKGTALP